MQTQNVLNFLKENYGELIAHTVTLPLVQIGLGTQINPTRSAYSQLKPKSLARISTFNILYYFPKKAVKMTLSKFNETLVPQENSIKSVLMRVGGETVAFSLIYPLSNIQTRLLAESSYKGFSDCIKQVWNTQGLAGFYSGFGYSFLAKVAYGLVSEGLSHYFHDRSYKTYLSYFAYSLTYPLKTLKERSIIEGMKVEGRTFKASLDKLSWYDLWAGLPVTLVSILLYESIPHLYN